MKIYKKYQDIKEGQQPTEMDELLLKQAVANELAIKNKLKAIELLIKIEGDSIPKYSKFIQNIADQDFWFSEGDPL